MPEQSPADKLRDLKFFSEKFFKIRSKSGSIESFCWNKAQDYIHTRLQAQLRETGKVRAIILKGRQQGCSTLIQARYFHKVITCRGIKTFILTHEEKATKNLFEITKRYNDYLPVGLSYRPDKNSVKELNYNELDSGYAIGTAGNKGTGRSQTIQLLHGSEVAFWQHAEDHAQGLMQAVGGSAGTEIILESTANGIGNYFHNMWCGATDGINEFQAIFIPWYWQPEYTDQTPGFRCTDDEAALYDEHQRNGMTKDHIAWRRKKVYEFSTDWDEGLAKFNQEFPTSAAIAFRNPIENTFINAKFVNKARNTKLDTTHSPIIIGVDPAIGDRDRCAIIRRQGRRAYGLEALRSYNTMELAGHIKTIIDNERPVKVFIDCIGIGAGTTDRLLEMGYSCVEGVNVARTANNKERYANLRAELWDEMKKWLMSELPVEIPDRDDLHADLCSLGFKQKSNGQMLIESKQALRDRGMPSCDLADALMLTFALGEHAGVTHYQPVFMPKAHAKMFT